MKNTIAAAAIIVGAATVDGEAAIIGSVDGPDTGFIIDMIFENTISAAVTKLTIDGDTADPDPMSWGMVNFDEPDEAGDVGGTAVVSSYSGPSNFMNQQVVEYDFSSFGLGDTFIIESMDPDRVSGSEDVQVEALIGVSVTAMFDDGSTRDYAFIDDPAPGEGLVLELEGTQAAVVPIPAAGLLLASALGALGLARIGRSAA